MMRCGQVRPLGVNTHFANMLTMEVDLILTIRWLPSPLFTGCGKLFQAVEELCPNPEVNQQVARINWGLIFIP